MAVNVGERAAWIRQSEIRSMTAACKKVDGINLAQGLCDMEVPLPVRIGAPSAIEEGKNTYTHYQGLMELREAIAVHARRYAGIEVDPRTEIVTSGGATGAMYCACLAMLNPGDEVILFEPYYGYHLGTLIAVQATPVFLRMRPPDWTFGEAELERLVGPRTRAIIVNTPANPSGKVFSRDELDTIARIAARNDLLVLTDEIYAHFVYDGRRHISPASLRGMRERTILVSGFSKTYAITGWRVGYCICNPEWTETIGHFNDLIYVCTPAPLQSGVARGIMELPPEYYEELARAHLVKRERICNALADGGLTPYVPQGSYYVLADMSSLPGRDSQERCDYLLEHAGVASVPGSAFYHDEAGDTLARFCFAKEEHVLDEACRRLARLRT